MVRPVVTALFLLISLATLPVMAGEECATLDVVVSPGNIQIDVTGAPPNALTFLAFSQSEGETSITFREVFDFTLGLDTPIRALPLGLTDGTGALSLSINLPVAGSLGVDLYGQSVSFTVEFAPGQAPPFTFDTCTSNVDPFSI